MSIPVAIAVDLVDLRELPGTKPEHCVWSQKELCEAPSDVALEAKSSAVQLPIRQALWIEKRDAFATRYSSIYLC